MSTTARSLDALLISDPSALLGASSSEPEAVRLIEGVRWPGRVDPDRGAPCPDCGGAETAVIGAERGTSAKRRRAWACKACKRQWSVRTGTRLEGGLVPLQHVLLALYLAVAEHETEQIDLDRALRERTKLSPPTTYRLAGETLAALRSELAAARTAKRRRTWTLGAVVALALGIAGWGTTVAASSPEPIAARWENAAGETLVRTPREPGESREAWRARHTALVERLQAFEQLRPAGS